MGVPPGASRHESDYMTRRVLISGAAGGIGRGLVERCVRAGWQVAALDVAPLTPVREDVLNVVADLTDDEQVAAAVQTVGERFGGIDGLVNNAAATPARAPLAAHSGERVAAVLDVNVTGVVRLTQAALPLLRAGSGPAVVNLSSIGGARAFRRNLGYCASKGAVEALTRALALDLAPLGIRVNAVAPGMVYTDAWRGVPTEEYARRSGLVPLGRPANVDEIAAAVNFLLGTDASYVTGVVLPVDGGQAAQAYAPLEEPGLSAVEDFPAGPALPQGTR